jgi:diketogulonate reductase-like aldo/keto reductase
MAEVGEGGEHCGDRFSKEGDCYDACIAAIKHGYRHIDTAAMYENEERVGEAIRTCGIPREELFVTTKLIPGSHNFSDLLTTVGDHTAETVTEALKTSLSKLGLDYIDLYLIHTPKHGGIITTWKTMIELQNQGLTKAIGTVF